MKPVRLSYILSLALFSSVSVLEATSLQEAVNNTLNNNPELKGIIQNNKAYKTYVDEAKGAYLPQIDLEVTGESRRTEVKIDGAEKTTGSQDGYDAQLNLEQLIYDGGLTPARIDESKFSERVNSYSNASKVDNVILTGIKSYLDLVKYDKRLNLSQVNVNTHQEYLKTAKSNEEISGNALDTHEVTAKLHLANKNYIDEIDNNQIAKNSFKRITGSEVEGSVCSPNVQRSTLPTDLNELVKFALTNNNTVLSQISKIKEQRAIINQEESKFLPTLKFRLSGTVDDDLIREDTKNNIYSGKIILNYNLYNGGRDKASNLREKLFLKESQEILDSKSDLVVDEVSSAFNTYNISKDKIKELQGYVNANEEILSIYKDQFEGGTRTFVDVLDIESDLYNAKVQLIDEEIKLVNTYYTMLNHTSQLQDVIVKQEAQNCSNSSTPKKKQMEKKDELEELKEAMVEEKIVAKEVPVVEKKMPVVKKENKEPIVEKKAIVKVEPKKVQTPIVMKKDYSSEYNSLVNTLESEFKKEIDEGSIVFDKRNLTFRITGPSSSMPIANKGMLQMTDEYKNSLNNFVPKLVDILNAYENEVSGVVLEGYSSSNFQGAKNDSQNFMANLKVSKKRAQKVLWFVKSIDNDIIKSSNDTMKKFSTFGRSYANPVLDNDGKENIEESKRVEFRIKTK